MTEAQKTAQLVFEMLRKNSCDACGALDRRCQVRVLEHLNKCQVTGREVSVEYGGPWHADQFEWSDEAGRWFVRGESENQG